MKTINKSFLIHSKAPQIVKNRLKRYPKDVLNYFQPIYTKRKNNEEGA